jgi:hypothetical protein
MAIEAMQGILNVTPDGVAGPKTYAALLSARQQDLGTGLHTSSDPLADAGVIALYELKIAWMRDGGIIDLPSPAASSYARCQKFIDSIIRTPIGIGWTWEDEYRANTSGQGNFEWCGAAAGYAWRKAGLKLSVAKDFFPSTYRLDRYARYKPINDTSTVIKPAQGPYRKIMELDEKTTVDKVLTWGWQMGDLLLVGPCKSAFGKHITLIESFDPKTGYFTTLEGNGSGLGPDGIRRHGVVRARRPVGLSPGMLPTVYHARRLIRVAPGDLI